MIKNWDIKLFLTTLIISVFGVVNLLSQQIGLDDLSIVNNQLIFLVIGFIGYYICARIDYSYLKHPQVILLIVAGCFVGLGLVELIGVGPSGQEAVRWIRVGGSFTIQPSEFVKLGSILVLAGLLSMRDRFSEDLVLFIYSFFICGVMFFLLLESHLSMMIVIVLISISTIFLVTRNLYRNLSMIVLVLGGITSMLMIFGEDADFYLPNVSLGIVVACVVAVLFVFLIYSQIGHRVLLTTILVGSLATGFLLSQNTNNEDVFRDYQRRRVLAVINPESLGDDNIENQNFQIQHSQIAIKNGDILGRGFGYGTQSRLRLLPDSDTDFVYASFVEQFGLIGGVGLILSYFFLIGQIVYIAVQNRSNTIGYTLCIGISVKLVIELFGSIGTNVGILPVTGVALPLFTRGGSITIITLGAIGVVQGVKSHE